MTEIYEKYRTAADKLEQAGFFACTDECHRLFEGDQWYGLDTGGQRLPVYNIIQPVVAYKTAMVAQNQVSLQYSPADYGTMTGAREGREEACRLLTAYARSQLRFPGGSGVETAGAGRLRGGRQLPVSV